MGKYHCKKSLTISPRKKNRSVMIHQVVFGSIEWFIDILIEHYAGKVPMWLAPVQIDICNMQWKL